MNLNKHPGERSLGINVLSGLVKVGLDRNNGRRVYVGVSDPYPLYKR